MSQLKVKTVCVFHIHSLPPLLTGGESYSVDYVAVISAKETGNTGVLMLPAKLTFRSPKLVFVFSLLIMLCNLCAES